MGYARRKGNPLHRAIAVIKIHNSHCINFMIKNTLIFARLVTVQAHLILGAPFVHCFQQGLNCNPDWSYQISSGQPFFTILPCLFYNRTTGKTAGELWLFKCVQMKAAEKNG